MKRLLILLYFFVCCFPKGFTQNLSPRYKKQCKTFMAVFKKDIKYNGGAYVWSPRESRQSINASLPSDSSILCFQDPASIIKSRLLNDTVVLSPDDIDLLNKNWKIIHDQEWRKNVAAIMGGFSSNEPWLESSEIEYDAFSAPQFLHNNNVCVIYWTGKSEDSRGGGFSVYKKDKIGWIYICDIYSYIS